MKWWLSALLVFVGLGCRPAGAEALTYECRHVLFGLLATLHYDVVEPEPGSFFIRLTGDAHGLAAIMDGQRHQQYESVVALQEDGRIMTRSHRRQTEINSRGRRIQYGWHLTYDTDRRIHAERSWGGRSVETCRYQLPAENYGDFLSALLAFQRESAPLTIGGVSQYTYFTLEGPTTVRVSVVGQEVFAGEGSGIPVWRCRVDAPVGRLPGGYRFLTLWCDSRRQIVQGKCEMLWGLGSVVVRRLTEGV